MEALEVFFNQVDSNGKFDCTQRDRVKSLYKTHHDVIKHIFLNGIDKKSFRKFVRNVHQSGPIAVDLCQNISNKTLVKLTSKKYKLSTAPYLKKYVMPTIDHACATNNDATNNDATNNDATNNDATNNDATNNDATNNDATNNDATNNDATNNDATNNDATNNDATNNDATNNDATNNDATNNDATNLNNYYHMHMHHHGTTVIKTIPHDIPLLQQDIAILKQLLVAGVDYMDAFVANASMIDKAAGLIKQYVNARLVDAPDIFEKSFDYTFDKLLLEFKSDNVGFVVDAVAHELQHVVKIIQHKFDIHYETSLIDHLNSHVYPTPLQYTIDPPNVLSLQFPCEQRVYHENEPGGSRPNDKDALDGLYVNLLNNHIIHRHFNQSTVALMGMMAFYNHDGLVKIKSSEKSAITEAISVIKSIISSRPNGNAFLLHAFQLTQVVYLMGLMMDGDIQYKLYHYCTVLTLYRKKFKAPSDGPMVLNDLKHIIHDFRFRYMDGIMIRHNVLDGVVEYIELMS